MFSNFPGGKYCASRTTCESVNATEIAIAPKTTIRFARSRFFTDAARNGKPAAARSEPPIEITIVQRHGNWVSCNGLNSHQMGRLRGTDMNRANPVTAITGRTTRLSAAASLKKSNNAGANNSSVISTRMFIHQTLRLSGEKVENMKLSR